MKLSLIHEKLNVDGRKRLQDSLKYIYGNNGQPTGINRSLVHQLDASGRDGSDPANRGSGGTGRAGDGGTPWKPRHRQFFRMSNDGATNTRY